MRKIAKIQKYKNTINYKISSSSSLRRHTYFIINIVMELIKETLSET